MTRLPRPLAWEAMAIHGLSGILFALSLVILAANASSATGGLLQC